MPTFTPPTVNESSSDPFFGRYSIPVGQTVIRKGGGFVVQPYPWLGDLAGLTDGEDYFLGGHIYTISEEVAGELEGAGFTVGGLLGYGIGAYGFGPYGE